MDAIVAAEERQRTERRGRGWFGRARDLLTSVIDRGLALPSEPTRARPEGRGAGAPPPPLPTVTLAEIYAAQGHLDRAIATLDEVLARDASHADATRLRERFVEQLRRTRPASTPQPVEARLEAADAEQAPAATLEPPSDRTEEASASSASAEAHATPALGDTQIDDEGDDAIALPDDALPPSRAEQTARTLLEVERFETDEVVAVAVDPTTVYLYWEVRPLSLAAARDRHPDGALVVRVLSVNPGSDGISSEQRDLRVDALHGELFVRGLPPGTHVRVTVGYAHVAGFDPFAVGVEVHTPRVHRASLVASRFARWAEGGGAPIEVERGETRPAPSGSPHLATDAAGPSAGAPSRGAMGTAAAWVGGGTASGSQTHVVEELPSLVVRAPGSSELLRRGAPWSRSVRWPSSQAMR